MTKDQFNKKYPNQLTLDQFVKAAQKAGSLDWDGAYGSQCFMAGHMILMEDLSYKPIEEVQIGDKVIGYSGINTVIQLHTSEAACVKTRTRLCDFYHTPGHPFLMKNGQFLPLSAIENHQPELYEKRCIVESGLTDDELKFLGFWLGDGNLGIHHDNRNDEVRVTYNIHAKAEYLHSLNITLTERPHAVSDQALVGYMSSREHPLLANIIRNCYDENRNKILRHEFTNREWMLIIDGFCRADGSMKNSSWLVVNTSKELLFTIQAAAYKCGYSTCSIRKSVDAGTPTTISDGKGGRKHIIRGKTTYRMTINYKSKDKSRDCIFEQEDIGIQTVYNLGVDGDHTYVCNNYYVHNCVDLIRFYIDKVFALPQPRGVQQGAIEFFSMYDKCPVLTKYFTKIPNLNDTIPQKGDIVVWYPNKGNGLCGHIAIVIDDAPTVKKMTVLEQNYIPQKIGVRTDLYAGCCGFLRRNNGVPNG